jgi:catechol 2,3-dioxygenase-like lactoylglutathione lyase family enzyme
MLRSRRNPAGEEAGMNGRLYRVGLAALGLVACSGTAPGDAPGEAAATAAVDASAPAATGTDAGIRNVSMLHLNIADMDRSLAWYQGVLGMQTVRDSGGPSPTPIVPEAGAMMHTVVLKTPGGEFSMELVEVSGVEVKPQQADVQDPGAVMLAVVVADLDDALAGARKLGLSVISNGGQVVVTEARGRQVMVRDADGFVSYLSQATEADAPSVKLDYAFISVADLDQTVAFYNGVFGLGMAKPGEVNATGARILGLVGNPALSQFRLTSDFAFRDTPGALRFQEFGGAEQTPVRHRVQDPGGPILTMTVEDFAGVMARVPQFGGTIGDGETSATLAPGATVSWIRDPNGLLIRVAKAAAE